MFLASIGRQSRSCIARLGPIGPIVSRDYSHYYARDRSTDLCTPLFNKVRMPMAYGSARLASTFSSSIRRAVRRGLVSALVVGAIVGPTASLKVRAQELPQKPVVAATTIFMRILGWWDSDVDIELTGERSALVLAKNPTLRAKGGISVRQVSDCKFEFAGPTGIILDFSYMSNEYVHGGRSTGSTLTFKGTRDGSPMCYEESCYRDLEIGGTRGQLQRILRAVEFISENSCPLRKLPF